jgi:CO/xanthine dehydrogenase Mo-binding subunit
VTRDADTGRSPLLAVRRRRSAGPGEACVIGASPRRKEDERLVKGAGRFLDDLRRPGMLHAGIVRSPHAHARVVKVAVDAALALPGVVAAFRAEDLPELLAPIPPYKAPAHFRRFEQPPLARDVVRYAGEPVAIVVADSACGAADAVEAVAVEYEPLPVVASVAGARDSASRVHPDWPDNVAGITRGVVGDVERGLAEAALVVRERFRHPRVAGMPLEPRGVLAWEDETGTLIVASSTQITHQLRSAIAQVLGLPEEQVRVFAPDTGGAFGAKSQVYADEILVPAVARRLRRPVKWVETRREHFVATCHDREQEHEIALGLRADGTLVAVDDRFRADFGAYPIQEDGVTANTINHLVAPFRVPHYRGVCENVVTNKMYSAAYRGAGRPEAAFVIDRALDLAARRLGIDPAELRRRNLITPAEMPYEPGLIYKDGVRIRYDPGDFPAAFNQTLELLGYERFRALQRERAGSGRRIGLGVSCYVHGGALGPYEGANVRVDPSGTVYVFIGSSGQGQGHATTLAQVCAAELGVRFEDVVVRGGDTQLLPYGFGAQASRIAANSGPAVARAAREVRRKALAMAATLLECAVEDVRLEDGRLQVAGVPGRSLGIGQVAGAAVRSKQLAREGDAGLNHCAWFAPHTVTWAFGAQAAAVEVDVETGAFRLLRYVAVHDSGRRINPVIVEGQLHGAITQALGAALMEDLVYDERGQLLAASFMDYGLPRATDVPAFVTGAADHPSVINDLGIKGVGESGAICAGAVVANAVEDALADLGIVIRELPVTAARIWQLVHEARRAGSP